MLWASLQQFLDSLSTFALCGLIVITAILVWAACVSIDDWITARKSKRGWRDVSRLGDPGAPRQAWPRSDAGVRPMAPRVSATQLADRMARRRVEVADQSAGERRRPLQSASVAPFGLSDQSCFQTTSLRFPEGDNAA